MTDAADAGRGPLSVAADLTLTVDGTEATLRSTGDRLFLEFPTVVSAAGALRDLPRTGHRRLHEALTTADLALEVRARNRTLAVLGAGSRAGALSRRLDVDPVEVRLCGVLSAVRAGVLATVDRLR
ncbi:hypothetical protein [Halobacterium yunchengense]|uniref:hypothetical protein n=1 Tax=Halobacterium yunchengense TaxID=3108497 RepID=UPI00300B12CD